MSVGGSGGSVSGSGGNTSGGTGGTGGTGGSAGAATGGSAGSSNGTGGSTGGSAGSGGSTTAGTGNGGGPPHVVADCDALPEADQWEEITPEGVTSVLNIVADPVNAGTVYAGTANKGLFKSTNCGADWVKINTGTNAAVLDSGLMWWMTIDPMVPETLYAGSLYGTDPSMQKSTDGGVNWASVAPPGSDIATTVDYNFFQEGSIDPLNHEHLVLSFHADCKGDYAPMCMAESTNSGADWRIFKGPANGWVENSRPMIINATTFLYVTWADGVWYTDNNGADWEKLSGIPGGNHQMFLHDGTYYLGTWQGVFKSTDGHAWTKIEGSPGGADGLATDGDRIFTGVRDKGDSGGPFFTAPMAAVTPWTTVTVDIPHGPAKLDYESDHHLLYAANTESGAWRMVTK
jgi:hypothetical protein